MDHVSSSVIVRVRHNMVDQSNQFIVDEILDAPVLTFRHVEVNVQVIYEVLADML